jgi:hypothetical protein
MLECLMMFLAENWAMLIVVMSFLIIDIIEIRNFFGLSTKAQKTKVTEWLLYAVIEAEKIFGSKTGTLKLRYVYDKFIDKFPAVARVIAFETFSIWVDEALVKMKDVLSKNTAIEEYTKEAE